MTKYKYIHFVKLRHTPNFAVFSCRENESKIETGQVKYYPAWRQYCYFPGDLTTSGVRSLKDIADFIGDKNRTSPFILKKNIPQDQG